MANETTIKINADAKQAINESKKLGKAFGNLDKEFEKSAKTMATSFGVAFAGLSAGFALAVKESAEFEQQMTAVKTLLDETSFENVGLSLSEGFAQVEKDTLGVLSEVAIASDQATKSLFDLISAGIPASEATAALATAGKLAVAGQTDVATATDGLTSALNAYQLGADQAEVVSAKFFAAQKGGKTTISELASGFGKVGSAAAALGISFDDLLASVSTLTTAGIKTSEAYTGIKAVLAGVAKPTKEAAEEAEFLGIQFDAAAIKSKGLKGFLDDLTASENFSEESVVKLFGSMEALNSILALTGNQAETYEKILANVSDETKAVGEFTDAYAVQSMTLAEQTQVLTNNIENLAVEIGDRLRPAIAKIVGFATSLIKKWGALDDSTKDTIIQMGLVATAIVGAVAAVATLVVGLGFAGTQVTAFLVFAKGLAAFMSATLVPAMGAALVAVKALTFFLLTNPIGIAITAITAAVVALHVAWTNNFLGIQETTFGVFGAIKLFFINFADTVDQIFEDLGALIYAALTGNFDGIGQAVDDLATTIGEAAGKIVEEYEEKRDKNIELQEEETAAQKIELAKQEKAAEKSYDAQVIEFQKFKDEQKKAQIKKAREAHAAQKKIEEKAAADAKKLEEDRAKDSEKATKMRLDRIEKVKDAEIDRIKGTAIEEADTILEISQARQQAEIEAGQLFDLREARILKDTESKELAIELVKEAELELDSTLQEIADATERRTEEILDARVKGAAKAAKEEERQAKITARKRRKILEAAFTASFDVGVSLISGGALKALDDAVNKILGAPVAFANAMDNLDETLINLPDQILQAGAKIVKELPKLINRFVKQFPKIVKQFVRFLPKIVQAIVDGVPKVVQAIIDALPAIMDAIMQAIPVILDSLPAIFEQLLDGISIIFEKLLQGLPKIIESLFDAIPKMITSLVDAIPGLIEILADNIGPIIIALIDGIIGGAGEIIAGLITSLLVEGGLERIVVAILKAIPRIVVALVVGVVKGLGTAASALGGAFSGAWKAMIANVGPAMETFFTETLTEGLSTAMEGVSGVFDEVAEGFEDVFGPIITFFTDILAAIQEAVDALSFDTGSGPKKEGGLIEGTGTPLDFLAKGTDAVTPIYAAKGVFMDRGTDTVPAMLSPNERVFSVPQNEQMVSTFNRAINALEGKVSGEGGGETVIRLVFSDSKFRDIVDEAIVEGSSLGTSSVQVAVGSEE